MVFHYLEWLRGSIFESRKGFGPPIWRLRRAFGLQVGFPERFGPPVGLQVGVLERFGSPNGAPETALGLQRDLLGSPKAMQITGP